MNIPLLILGFTITGLQLNGQYAIPWSTADAGGGRAGGGPYVARTTLGQLDAGISSGGAYVLRGGFWGPRPASPVGEAPSLRIFLSNDGEQAILAWPELSPGFQLQESSSLLPPDWKDVEGGVDLVAQELQVQRPISAGAKFYRLRGK